MGTRIIKLPDVGEGVAEAEIVEWHVKVGESVLEDQILAAVMTDKATVEIPSPVAGKVLALGGEVGGMLAVGAELVRLEVAGEGNAKWPRRRAKRHRAAQPPAERLTTPPPAPEGAGTNAGWSAATPVARGRWDRRGRPARSRSPRRRCGGARARPASTCARCAAAARPAASPTTTSTPSCAAGRRPRRRGGGRVARHRGRDGQGHRPAPAHRPEDGRVQAPRRALLLCRGGRRHRARGAARAR